VPTWATNARLRTLTNPILALSSRERERAALRTRRVLTKHRGENKAHTKWRAEALNEKDEEEVGGAKLLMLP
jgi:hypothetical protein